MSHITSSVFLLILNLIILCISETESATFTITNRCPYTVWPAISKPLGKNTTGFILKTGESRNLTAPTHWNGQIWGRTNCSDYQNNGIYYCITGNCRVNAIDCLGPPSSSPATLAEFSLDTQTGPDFFGMSLLKGYNLPLSIVPKSRNGENCTIVACEAGINEICPRELKVMSEDRSEVVGCKSPCAAFGTPEFCCTGKFSSKDSCRPSTYSQVFKYTCPQAYSYNFDVEETSFTCPSADFEVTFCPSSNNSTRARSPKDESKEPASSPQRPPWINGSTDQEDKSEALLLVLVNVLRLCEVAFVVSFTLVSLLFL